MLSVISKIKHTDLVTNNHVNMITTLAFIKTI